MTKNHYLLVVTFGSVTINAPWHWEFNGEFNFTQFWANTVKYGVELMKGQANYGLIPNESNTSITPYLLNSKTV